MPDATEMLHAERTEMLRGVADRLMEVWPAESRPEGAEDSDELREAMNALNRELTDGQGGTLARLMAENVAYRVLVHLGETELTTGVDLSFRFAAGPTPYFVAMAMGWVVSAARRSHDFVFATMMMGFKGDMMVECLRALLDAGAALRENAMHITVTPAADDGTTLDTSGE